MPHKNDIKFVKTERRNDRTASSYRVGDEGKAQEKGRAETSRRAGGDEERRWFLPRGIGVVNEIEAEQGADQADRV